MGGEESPLWLRDRLWPQPPTLTLPAVLGRKLPLLWQHWRGRTACVQWLVSPPPRDGPSSLPWMGKGSSPVRGLSDGLSDGQGAVQRLCSSCLYSTGQKLLAGGMDRGVGKATRCCGWTVPTLAPTFWGGEGCREGSQRGQAVSEAPPPFLARRAARAPSPASGRLFQISVQACHPGHPLDGTPRAESSVGLRDTAAAPTPK